MEKKRGMRRRVEAGKKDRVGEETKWVSRAGKGEEGELLGSTNSGRGCINEVNQVKWFKIGKSEKREWEKAEGEA